jgi:curved DNA-binding protein
MKDYYQVLGISKEVSYEEIKKAFRRLASRYHPDHNPQSQKQAEEKSKEINEAYQVLGDEHIQKNCSVKSTGPTLSTPFTMLYRLSNLSE